MLLFQLLDLLQGEEGFSALLYRLLRVSLTPLLKGFRVTALHVLPNVLPMPGHEVAHVTRERLFTCRTNTDNSVKRY